MLPPRTAVRSLARTGLDRQIAAATKVRCLIVNIPSKNIIVIASVDFTCVAGASFPVSPAPATPQCARVRGTGTPYPFGVSRPEGVAGRRRQAPGLHCRKTCLQPPVLIGRPGGWRHLACKSRMRRMRFEEPRYRCCTVQPLPHPSGSRSTRFCDRRSPPCRRLNEHQLNSDHNPFVGDVSQNSRQITLAL